MSKYYDLSKLVFDFNGYNTFPFDKNTNCPKIFFSPGLYIDTKTKRHFIINCVCELDFYLNFDSNDSNDTYIKKCMLCGDTQNYVCPNTLNVINWAENTN
jgi:hypothetical protein